MATKTLKTRIQLKYDTYANWTSNNPTPLSGEVCIVVVPAAAGAVVQEPALLMKVGDGTTAFNSLNFVGGIAADVYDWAKAANKPTYAASEITGIGDYIATYVDETLGISVDTDTQYRITKVDDYNYKLQSKAKGEADTAYADVSEIVIPKYDDTALAGRVTAVETLVGSTAVATQIANAIAALDLANTYEAKGTAATEAGKVQDALDEYKEANDGVIAAIKDGISIDSFKDVEDALAGKQAAGDYATKAQAQAYADAKDTAINAAKQAADDAQADVDALAEKVGTVTDGKTVVQMIEEAKTAATYDDTEVRGLISDNADDISDLNGKMNTLIGDDTGKSARTIANEELAKQLIPEGADEALNTLEEIAAWIQDHPDDAAAMNAAIAALQAKVDTGDQTVTAYVTAAINALNIGDYAKAADLTALAARVTTAEGKITSLETEVAKKANDADLAAIAKTGNVNDLVQTDGDYIIFNCGSATEVI